MPENMTIGEREKLLDKLKPGTPLYMSGHAMLYIGTEDGKPYVIHDFSGFYKPQQQGNAKYYRVREVMVSPLRIGSPEDGKTYIEGLYGAKRFCSCGITSLCNIKQITSQMHKHFDLLFVLMHLIFMPINNNCY